MLTLLSNLIYYLCISLPYFIFVNMIITRIIKGFIKIGMCIWCNLFESDEEHIEEGSILFLGKILSPVIFFYAVYHVFVKKEAINQPDAFGDTLSISTTTSASNLENHEDDRMSHHSQSNQNVLPSSANISYVSLYQRNNVQPNENFAMRPEKDENSQLGNILPHQIFHVRSSRILLNQNNPGLEPNLIQMQEHIPEPINDNMEGISPRRTRRPQRKRQEIPNVPRMRTRRGRK